MIEIGSALDPGQKRIATKNQDALCVVESPAGDDHPPLLVIADGMGGYAGGAIASQLVVSSFTAAYRSMNGDRSPLQVLQAGVNASLVALKQQASQDPALGRMGSTVVAAMVEERQFSLLNVGDSRAYLVNARQVRQVSYDHSLVGEQMRQGLITAAQLRYQPCRNVLSMAISAQRESVETFTGVFAWEPGDCLVLCSDGLWGPVTETQIQSAVLSAPPQQAAERLVAMANANRGPDNISVIIARLR